MRVNRQILVQETSSTGAVINKMEKRVAGVGGEDKNLCPLQVFIEEDNEQ